jgi:hypothetical protein
VLCLAVREQNTGRSSLLTQKVDGTLVHDVEEHQEVHGEQPEGGQGDFVFGLVVERLDSASEWGDNAREACGSYLTFEQRSNLVLHAFCLAQQALVDAQSLQTALATAHIVDPRRAVLNGAAQQVLCVCPYIVALGLHGGAPSAVGASHVPWTRYLQ